MEEKTNRLIGKKLVAAAMALGVVVGSAGIANALTAQDDSTTPDAAQPTETQDESLPEGDDDDTGETGETEVDDDDDYGRHDDGDDDHDDGHDDDHDGRGGDDELLTGDLADQVTAAAEAAVPGGTVTKVEHEDDGFEAHVTGTDGVEVGVYFDADMNVTSIE